MFQLTIKGRRIKFRAETTLGHHRFIATLPHGGQIEASDRDRAVAYNRMLDMVRASLGEPPSRTQEEPAP